MPYRIETDAHLRSVLGTDGPAWANSYLRQREHYHGIAQLHELAAWFDMSIRNGLSSALSIGSGPAERTPMVGQCSDPDCNHRWVIAWLPMEADAACGLMARAACPLCANTTVYPGKFD
jgi:hypothetical protein